jgi:hypothetical protein
MQSIEDDDIRDYNELLAEYSNILTSSAPDCNSHSPTQTPPSLKSDEDSDEVDSDLGKGQDTKMDLEEGQEIEMDSTSTQQALIEHKQTSNRKVARKWMENEIQNISGSFCQNIGATG